MEVYLLTNKYNILNYSVHPITLHCTVVSYLGFSVGQEFNLLFAHFGLILTILVNLDTGLSIWTHLGKF